MAILEHTKPKLNAILKFSQATNSKKNFCHYWHRSNPLFKGYVLGLVHYFTRFKRIEFVLALLISVTQR